MYNKDVSKKLDFWQIFLHQGGEIVRVYMLDEGGLGLERILIWLAEKTYIREVAVIKRLDLFLERVERERPDMVFIRLGNSENSGLKTGQIVKAMDQDIRLIIVSDEKESAVDAYEVGAYGYLLCPVEKGKFEKILFE